MTVDNDTVEAVRERLSTLAGRPELRHSRLGQANPVALALAAPHRIFTLGVGELVERTPIDQAHPIAQGFLVLDGIVPIANVEVTLAGGFITISEGPFVEALRRAIDLVDGPALGETAEVRVLRLPEVQVVALWLHQAGGLGDVLVPLAPTPVEIDAYRTIGPTSSARSWPSSPAGIGIRLPVPGLISAGQRTPEHVKSPDGGMPVPRRTGDLRTEVGVVQGADSGLARRGVDGDVPDRRPAFDVFLSYNSRDRRQVERIARHLQQRDIVPWFDRWSLTPGGAWQDEISDGLRHSAACAVFVGPDDLGDWSRMEMSVALNRAGDEPGFRLFPVLLPGLDPFEPTDLPPLLVTRTWVDMRDGPESESSLRTLINAVLGVPFGSGSPPTPTCSPARTAGWKSSTRNTRGSTSGVRRSFSGCSNG